MLMHYYTSLLIALYCAAPAVHAANCNANQPCDLDPNQPSSFGYCDGNTCKACTTSSQCPDPGNTNYGCLDKSTSTTLFPFGTYCIRSCPDGDNDCTGNQKCIDGFCFLRDQNCNGVAHLNEPCYQDAPDGTLFQGTCTATGQGQQGYCKTCDTTCEGSFTCVNGQCVPTCDAAEDCTLTEEQEGDGRFNPGVCSGDGCQYSECKLGHILIGQPGSCPSGEYCAPDSETGLNVCVPGCVNDYNCASPSPFEGLPAKCIDGTCDPSTCDPEGEPCPSGECKQATSGAPYKCVDQCTPENVKETCTSPPDANHYLNAICKNGKCEYSTCKLDTTIGCTDYKKCVAVPNDLNKCVDDGTKCNPYADKCPSGKYCHAQTKKCKDGCKKQGSACVKGTKHGKCNSKHECIVPYSPSKKVGASCSTKKSNDCGSGKKCVAKFGYKGYCHKVAQPNKACGKEYKFPTVCTQGYKCKKHVCKKY